MKTIGETIVVVNIIDDIGFDIDSGLKLLGLKQSFARQKLIKPIQLGARGTITNNIQRARKWINSHQGLRDRKLQFRCGKSARQCC